MKDYSGKKIKIIQEVTNEVMEEVEIHKDAIIPSWCGSCKCSICEDDIDDDTQVVFSVPYHLEYAHIKCFKEATQ